MAACGVIWCIGGLDTSGGAGLLRDGITAASLGMPVAQAVTLISVQTHHSAISVQPTALSDFEKQLSALQAQAPLAVKIGALASSAQCRALTSLLHRTINQYPDLPVIWDPVLTASTGQTLGTISREDIDALLDVVTILTPNLPELGRLAEPFTSQEHQARGLLRGRMQAVLVKGGHRRQAEATDTLYTAGYTWQFASAMQPVQLRGTGCLLASAIAVLTATGFAPEDAVCQAKARLNQCFHTALPVAQQPDQIQVAPCLHHALNQRDLPRVDRDRALCVQADFARLEKPDMGLYPVVDSLDWLEQVLQSGVRVAQLRIKTITDALPDIIHQAVALGRKYHSQVFINDHWQLALAAGAYGVHLGQDDLQDADLPLIARSGLRLGISTHGYAELGRVLALRPSYIALGHIFATKTKQMPSAPQGPERLAAYAELCGDIPTVAIGGISIARAPQVWATGVDGLAVVTAITEAADPVRAIHALQEVTGHV